MRRLTTSAIYANAGDAQGSRAVVADQPAREADQIGVKVVRHGRCVTLQMAEVACAKYVSEHPVVDRATLPTFNNLRC
jgi:hypothetical protein